MQERILKAAARQIAEHGFDGTTLQAVADEVGVRKPSVLHHFPSKDALRKAVLDRIFDHWNQVVPRVMMSAGRGASRFDALAGEMVRYYSGDPNTARVVLREMLDRPDVHRRIVASSMHLWFQLMGHGIAEGKRQGRYLPDVDTEMYIAHILRFILVVIATRTIYPAAPRGGRDLQEREVRELLRIARTALLTPATIRSLEKAEDQPGAGGGMTPPASRRGRG